MARASDGGRQQREGAGTPGTEGARGESVLDRTEHSWTLQMLNALSSDVGGLKEAVNGLKQSLDSLRKEDIKELKSSVNWITRALWVSAGVLLAVGYFLNGRISSILEELAKLATK